MYKYETTTEKSIDKVFLELGNRLREKGYAVLSYVDLKQILKEKLGSEFHGYYILEVCRPAAAKELISKNSDYGLFLPCKIVIEEAASARTCIKVLLVTEMASEFLKGGNEAEKFQAEIIEAVKTI
jgi:uncharacterized protein (DUF302 family)